MSSTVLGSVIQDCISTENLFDLNLMLILNLDFELIPKLIVSDGLA